MPSDAVNGLAPCYTCSKFFMGIEEHMVARFPSCDTVDEHTSNSVSVPEQERASKLAPTASPRDFPHTKLTLFPSPSGKRRPFHDGPAPP